MNFLKPVYIVDTLTANVELIEVINEFKNIILLQTLVINQKNDKVYCGFAVVKAPKREE